MSSNGIPSFGSHSTRVYNPPHYVATVRSIFFSFRVVLWRKGAVRIGAQHSSSEWQCKAEFNQTHGMRAALKKGMYTADRGGTVRTSQGFNQGTVPFILERSALGSWLQNCFHYALSWNPLKKLTFLTSNGYVITFISALTPALMDFLSFWLWSHLERTSSPEYHSYYSDQMSFVLRDSFNFRMKFKFGGLKSSK